MGGDLHGRAAPACADGAETLPLIPDGVCPAGRKHCYLVRRGISRDVDVAGEAVAEQCIANESTDEEEPMPRAGERCRQRFDSFQERLPVTIAQHLCARLLPPSRGRSRTVRCHCVERTNRSAAAESRTQAASEFAIPELK